MRPSWVCVAVAQNVTVRRVEYAMNFPCFGTAMHEKKLVSGTGHSETADPVDASNCAIFLSDRTKRWLSSQRRPVLYHGVTRTLMSASKRPSLSQTRMESGVAVAIRSPCGEYLAALTQSLCWSVCTRLRVAMSEMVAVRLSHAETSRVESGEKSTPLMSFVCLCVPHKDVAPACPCCDPSAILGHRETPYILRFQCCHLFAVFHSPHSNPTSSTADNILAIRCKCHCPYVAAGVDFGEQGSLLSNG